MSNETISSSCLIKLIFYQIQDAGNYMLAAISHLDSHDVQYEFVQPSELVRVSMSEYCLI